MKACVQMKMYLAAKNSLQRFRRLAVLPFLAAPSLLVSMPAYALKLSDFSTGWEEEAGAITPVVLMLIMAAGILFAGFAVVSGIIAKKNQEPLRWQLWGVVGGAMTMIIPALLMAMSGSLSSDNDSSSQVLSDLNINY